MFWKLQGAAVTVAGGLRQSSNTIGLPPLNIRYTDCRSHAYANMQLKAAMTNCGHPGGPASWLRHSCTSQSYSRLSQSLSVRNLRLTAYWFHQSYQRAPGGGQLPRHPPPHLPIYAMPIHPATICGCPQGLQCPAVAFRSPHQFKYHRRLLPDKLSTKRRLRKHCALCCYSPRPFHTA